MPPEIIRLATNETNFKFNICTFIFHFFIQNTYMHEIVIFEDNVN